MKISETFEDIRGCFNKLEVSVAVNKGAWPKLHSFLTVSKAKNTIIKTMLCSERSLQRWKVT